MEISLVKKVEISLVKKAKSRFSRHLLSTDNRIWCSLMVEHLTADQKVAGSMHDCTVLGFGLKCLLIMALSLSVSESGDVEGQ